MIILLFVSAITLKGCPFTYFEEGLMPIEENTATIQKQLHLDSNDLSLSIGFWTLSRGDLNNFIEYERIILQITGYEQDINFLLVQGTEEVKVEGQFFIIKYMVNSPLDGNSQIIQYSVPFQDRQDRWVFTLITFQNNFSRFIIEMTDQTKSVMEWQILEQDHLYNFTIGCDYCSYYKDFFEGRISKLIFFENYFYQNNQFQIYSEICKIPEIVSSPQEIIIISGLISFQNQELFSKNFYEAGRKYCLFGWAKFAAPYYSTQQILLRLSQNKLKGSIKISGDDLLKLRYYIFPSSPQTKISITIDSFCDIQRTSLCLQEMQNNFQDYQIISFELQNTKDDSYYFGITQWHYFQYEYGRNVTNGIEMLFQMQFFNSIGHISQSITELYKSSWVNGVFYIFIGETEKDFDFLQASIYDLKIRYYYQYDQELLLKCDKSCLTCNGPLINNCLSCTENFMFNSLTNTCLCKPGYLKEGDNNSCIKFEDYFSTLSFQQKVENDGLAFCDPGYYLIPNSKLQNLCLQCPQRNPTQVVCADCWINQSTWYLNPICSSDFILTNMNDMDYYVQIYREIEEIDLFVIDDNFNLILLKGYSEFCNLNFEISNCNSVKLQNLIKEIFAKCKPNYLFGNGVCYQKIEKCSNYDNNENCLTCSLNYYLKEQTCLICPLNCDQCVYDEVQQLVICLKCQIQYGLINNQCQKCGLFCYICQGSNQNTNSELGQLLQDFQYLTCIKCIDDQKYYISYDKINCQLNTIDDCKYVVQLINSEVTFNYNVDLALDESGIFTTCALCKNSLIYNYDTKVCSNQIEDSYQLKGCLFGVVGNQNGHCIINSKISFSAFYTNCNQYVENCELCLFSFSDMICLTCSAGYYSHMLTGQCFACPTEFNCAICGQQSKVEKDFWKQEIRAFWVVILQTDTYNSQSQNIEDYEIICKVCKDGYVLINDQCIIQSIPNCEDFTLKNGKLLCSSCQKSTMISNTITDNQCIYCQDGCSLCRSRSIQEIQRINSQFNDEKYLSYTGYCMKESNQKDYYGEQISQQLNCRNNQKCKNQIIIEMNLFCSEEQYLLQINQFQNIKEKKQFQQKNILINDLFSSHNFQEFEKDIFYQQANFIYVKEIFINIISEFEQVCYLQNQAILTQIFQSHIFSLEFVHLKLDFKKKVEINYLENISFINFYSVLINNATFIPQQPNKDNVISFTSFQYQKITLQHIVITQIQPSNNRLYITIENSQILEVQNLTFSNLQIKDQKYFLFIKLQDIKKQLILKNVNFENCSFENTLFFQFNLLFLDTLLIQGLRVKSNFSNATIINSIPQSSKESGDQIILSEYSELPNFIDVQIQAQLLDTYGLFFIDTFDEMSYTNFEISDSVITNSSIVIFNSKIMINNFVVRNSKIQGSSQVIENYNNSKVSTLQFKCISLSFQGNQYDPNSHFILFRKLASLEQIIQISNFNIIDNYGKNQYEIYNKQGKSLVYLQANNIFITNLLLQKGFGIVDLFINDALNFTLLNAKISQNQKFKFQGLYSKLDCLNSRKPNISFVTALSIYSAKYIFFNKLSISDVQNFNFPIILYNSANTQILEQDEIFIIQEANLNNNLLIQTDILSSLSIIQINSQQKSTIMLFQCDFFNNLFHSYLKNYQKSSSTLLNVDCNICNLVLNSSKIVSNIVTNSSDSIIFVNSQSVWIDSCVFQRNAIFNYEILSQYIFWDQNYEQVYEEQIEQMYPINSEAGNGFFIAQMINIVNTNISQSQGQTGGAFKLQGIKDCVITLLKLYLNETKTLFSPQVEQGGAFYIDGSQSQSISVEINLINGNNIFCKNEGGFIYLKIKNQNADIVFKSLDLQNVYSQKGSFIYIEFQQLPNNIQSVWLSDIKFENTQPEFNVFLNQYKDISEFDQTKLLLNRTVIFIEYGLNLYCNDFYFQNLDEGFMYLYGIQNVVLSNILVQNSQFKVYFLKITPLKYQFNLIQIRNFYFFNITQSAYYLDYSCFTRGYLQPLKYLQCSSTINTHPIKIIQYYSIEKISNQISRCKNQENSNLSVLDIEGLIILNGLSELSKIKIFNGLIEQINCSSCQNGVLLYQYVLLNNTILQKSTIQNITISFSKCGENGCLNFEKKASSKQLRILRASDKQIFNYEHEIIQYFCSNNTANFGTCLNIQNVLTMLSTSNLQNNKALQLGGAIYINGNQPFIVFNSQIHNNQAEVGGGVYFEHLQQINYLKLNNYIQYNKAKLYGENYKVSSENLQIFIQNNTKLEEKLISQNDSVTILEVGKTDNSEIYLPSGQALGQYQIFDQLQKSYLAPNNIFRVRAVQFDNGWSKNLTNSFCVIQTRKINTSNNDEQIQFSNNYTNIKNVSFDLYTQEYNLDNLIIFFDSDEPKEVKLQLEFQCSSITVMQYEESFPFMLKYFHNNYKIRMKIKTYPCQYGEIKNQTDNSCYICDYQNGFFSLKLNQPKCDLKNDETTISVKSAMLELKKGYWRPFFDTAQINYCQNLPSNCLGGWVEGDSSCILGHIGALCEQCDISNVRGDGHFAMNEKYNCGTCTNQTRNLFLLIFAIIWTLSNLFLSVQGNLKVQDEYSKPMLFYSHRYSRILDKSQTGILMKMLTNYLQIIASLATFELNLSSGFTNFLNIAGNPIETTTTSQDCLIINQFHNDIQYTRAIWLLLFPFLYVAANLFIFFIGSRLKVLQFNVNIVSTSILHIYLYFQPNMISNLMLLLSYRDISGYKWIKANVSASYDTEAHFKWMLTLALPLLLTFGLLIPLLLFYNLFKNKQMQQKKQFMKIWGYLYHEYSSNTYYWEIVKIFEKQFIIIILSFFEEIVALKGILMVLITLAYSELLLIKKPYTIKKINDLDISSTNSCIISVCFAITIYICQLQNLLEIQIPFWLILGFVNLRYLFKLIYNIVYEHIRNFTNSFDITQIRTVFPTLRKVNWINRYLDSKIKQKMKTKQLFQKLKKNLFPICRSTLQYKKSTFKNIQATSSESLSFNLAKNLIQSAGQKFQYNLIQNTKSDNL